MNYPENIHNIRLIAKIFTSALFKDLGVCNESRLSDFLNNYNSENYTIKELFEYSYENILKQNPNEYVYKNEIINQIILKNNKIEETTIFTEFWCHTSKADLIVIDNKPSVYEIKTELDNLSRLKQQIDNYKSIFPYVNIITYPSNISKIESLLNDENIGIITYDKLSQKIEIIKEAKEDISKINSEYLFRILRQPEFKKFTETIFGFIPDVPNTLIYNECYKLFKTLPKESQLNYVYNILKDRKIKEYQILFTNNLPNSLKALAVTSKFTKKQCNNIINILNKKGSV